MKISIQTGSIVDKFGIEEGFRMIQEAGFEAVDMNLDPLLRPKKILDKPFTSFFDQPDGEILAWCAPYREAASRHGIAFTQAHAPFPNRLHDESINAYILRAVEKTIMMCGALGCPRLVVHAGYLPYADRCGDEWDYNMRMYSALIPALREHGVMCCLENLFTRYRGKIICGPCASAPEANRWVDALNDRAGERLFGFCLDVGHALLAGRDLYEFVTQLGGNLACLHLHDNDGMDDRHMFPYSGILDWERLCRALGEIGYRGDLSFETFNGLDQFPPELAGDALRLAGAVAAYFRRRVMAEQNR